MLKNTKNTNHISLLNLTEITKSNSKPPLLLNSHGSHLKVQFYKINNMKLFQNKIFRLHPKLLERKTQKRISILM